jgi:subtilase family serine protease
MTSSQQHIHNTGHVLPLRLFLFIFTLLIPVISFSADFTARTIGAYGNVAVMEVTGSYDANLPDSTLNAEPREIIAQEFFKTYADEYDFIVVFSNFDFKMPEVQAKAFYMEVRNDTIGIGKPMFDNSSLFGSNGKLQGMVDMGNVASISSDLLDKEFEKSLYRLGHEIMHRWGAYVRFRYPDGTISSAMLGKDRSHWSFLLDSYGSVLYGNQWRDNGDGTFTSIAGIRNYSPLDLYLMGLVDKSQLPPMLLIDNPNIDPERMSETEVTIAGTAHYVTIDEIIAAEGARIPGVSDSQKSFKTAFILITTLGTFTGNELYGIETIRNEWVKRYSILTDGRGIVQVALMPREDVPINPEPEDPPIVPRTLPPDIYEGVRWLVYNQKPDGSWFDLVQTAERDTAEAVFALKSFVSAQPNCSTGVRWLLGAAPDNTDYVARTIETLKSSGQDTYALVNELLLRKNPDGGWGGNAAYVSNPVDTSFALRALSVAGYSEPDTVSAAVAYLRAKQNADGGWGRDEGSNIEVTANVLRAFNKYREDYQLQGPISAALAWLTQKQKADGGFGNSQSTVYDTAIAVLALQENEGLRGTIESGLNYILNLQSKDGSWYQSPHQTALAVAAVWAATVEPDLSIKTEDITFTPATVNTLPANIALHVKIENMGKTDVSQARVALYESSVSEATRIGEQTLAVAGQSSSDVTFAVTINDANEHRFYVQLDPDNLIKESNKANNLSSNAIRPTPTYDFEILPADITVVPNELDISEDVRILATITNKGTMNAYNIQVRYYLDDAGGPMDIATRTLDIPANTTVHNEILWKTDRAGNNLPLTVWVDPANLFTEISKDNNKAAALLTIWPATLEPDLSIKPEDITFTPPRVTTLPANIAVKAKIWNLGRTAVSEAKVVLYADSVSEATKIAEQMITVSGQSWVDITFPAAIRDGNEHSFHVLLDPEDLIHESNETNNGAYNIISPTPTYDFEVLPADIGITPNPAVATQDVKIVAKITNKGTMNAYNVQIKYYIDTAGGPIDIATKTVDMPANSTVLSQVTWKPDRAGENLPVTVWVDPFNLYAEISKTNNKASVPLTVNSATDPNLTISYKDIVITPAIPNELGNANISVMVKNAGLTAVNNVTANFYNGIPGVDGVLIGSRVIPSINPGESKQAAFEWTNIPESGEKILYVKIDPDNLIKETRKEDNDAFVTMKILSLPDFAISSNAILFTPSAPKEGDTVAIKVTVKNLGEQAVPNVPVKVSEGGSVVGTQSIPLIPGNAQTVATFSYNTTAKKGVHEISATVDPAGTIVERSKSNNTASRTFGVQDASLWLTEPYLSPNGDGIKDSTQFFFRLQEPKTVKIVVVNERDETVRTFSGGGLDNTVGDTITWDGLNDIGMVVDDGDYHLEIIDGKTNVLGSLMVVVDNNRSPLTKAIGTKYLLNNNLTCMLPDIDRWEWFLDESGILLSLAYTNPNAPEYHAHHSLGVE